MLEISDLAGCVNALRVKGVHFRNEIVTGVVSRSWWRSPLATPLSCLKPIRPEARIAQN